MSTSEKSGRIRASSSKMTLDNPPEQAAGFDARFQTAGVAGFEADQSETAEKFEEEEEDASDAEDGQQSEGDGDEDSSRLLKPLSKAELEAFERKQKKRGVIYISHIPHGMTVAKVKHLLEGFGEVDRIFLHDGSVKPGEKRKRTTAHFTEGWVEFKSKKVAKTVAALLNAQPIGAAAVTKSSMKSKTGGSRKSRRFQDDVWTMKYLPGYKWQMLTTQLANERASHTARLRTELSQSAFEQKDYLRKVERARIMDEKAEKKRRRLEREQTSGTASANAGEAEAPARDGQRVRTFKQREPVYKDVRDDKTKAKRPERGVSDSKMPKIAGGKALESVLSSIF